MTNPAERILLAGLIAVLCFAIVTTSTPSYWAVAASQVSIFFLAITWCVRQLRRPASVRGTWLLIPLSLATVWGACQIILGGTAYRFATLVKSLQWLACFVAFFLAVQLFVPTANQRLFRRVIIWFGLALSILSMLQYLTSGGRIFWFYPTGYEFPTLGPFVNRDHYSAFIELLLPISIYKLRHTRRVGLYAAAAATLYASGILGASRAGAILTTSLVIVVTLITFRQSHGSRTMRTSVLLAASVILFTMIVGWERTWARLNLPEPFQGRSELNRASLVMISDYPWAGSGLGTWPSLYPRHAAQSFRVYMNAAHNDWAQWAVEGGLLFPCLFLSIFAWCLMRAKEAPWSLGMPAVFIHSGVDFPLEVPAFALWFFVMLGALASGPAASREEASPRVR